MLDTEGIINNCEYIKKTTDYKKIDYDNTNGRNPAHNPGRDKNHQRESGHNYERNYEYEFNCPQRVIQGASSSGTPDLDGLFKLLKIDKDKNPIFVIVNKKITFFNLEVKEGDHIELLPVIDGG
jgi:hypothetical protein